jgi:hypothetical protein
MPRSGIASGGGAARPEVCRLGTTQGNTSTRLERLLRECERLLDEREFEAAARLVTEVCTDYECAVTLAFTEHGHHLSVDTV